MAERQLKVPLGIAPDGMEVRPGTANPDAEYFCPDCHMPLVLRRGTQKRPHFAHKADPDTNRCDFVNESEAHWRAKHRIVHVFQAHTPVRLWRECPECHQHTWHPLPTTGVLPSTEHRLSSNLRADVALLDPAESVRAIFEVCQTHEVDEDKAEALRDVPWIEVRAEEVLGGDDWKPTKDHLFPVPCATCRDAARYGYRYKIQAPERLFVACPLPNLSHKANLIDDCGVCKFFVSASPDDVFCFGSKAMRRSHV